MFRLEIKNNMFMENELQIINKTFNGIVSKHTYLNEYQITYKNLCFNLSLEGYDRFTNYIIRLNTLYGKHLKENPKCECYKVHVPTANKTLDITFTKEELSELTNLFSLKPYESFKKLSIDLMEYNFCLN